MKKVALILILFIPVKSIAQFCNDFGNIKINCFDTLGRKQGFWRERVLFPITSIEETVSKNDPNYYNDSFRFYTIAEGHYNNDIKVNDWVIYASHLLLCETYNLDRIEENTITNEIKAYNYCSKITYNKDSSIIRGALFSNLDTITLQYAKKECKLSFHNQQIYTSPISYFYQLQLIILKATNGYFAFIIKTLSK